MKKLMILVVGVYSVLVFASLVFGDVSAGKLVTENCSSCHGMDRVCARLGRGTPEDWKRTVTHMRSLGAHLTNDDAATVAEYLAASQPGNRHLNAAAAAGRKARK